MGITIRCKRKPKISCSFSYGRFYDIRLIIAKSYNSELGKIYENSVSFEHSVREDANKNFNELYKIANEEERLLMRFLSTPDEIGEADGETCKFLLRFKDEFFKEDVPEITKDFYYKPFWNVIENGTKFGIRWG